MVDLFYAVWPCPRSVGRRSSIELPPRLIVTVAMTLAAVFALCLPYVRARHLPTSLDILINAPIHACILC